MKKFGMMILGVVLAAVALACFAGCNLQLPSVQDVKGLVIYPEQYSITYEIEAKDGTVTALCKTVDAQGNVYYQNGATEQLYLKNGDQYVLYQKDQNGEFVALPGSSYVKTYVDEQTKQFSEYAEMSRNQLMPTAKKQGEQEVLGRACDVYVITVGGDKTGVKYSYYVDRATGICLGYESGMSAVGFDLGADGEIFRCTGFVTEGVPDLAELVKGE